MSDATSTCRSCGAAIVWAAYASGKRSCFDAEPTLAGNVILSGSTTGKPSTARVQTAEEKKQRDNPEVPMAGRVRFVDHHATCPQGKTWKKAPA